MKNKKGFSLVELCVVLAVVTMIVLMICQFIRVHHQSTYGLKEKDDFMYDITAAQGLIEEWVGLYDNGYYDISISDDKKTVSAAGNSNATAYSITTTSGNLAFDATQKRLTNSRNSKYIVFEAIKDIQFSFAKQKTVNDDGTVTATTNDNKSIVICTLTSRKNETQKLVFSFQSQISRNRFSSVKRTDATKIKTATDAWINTYSSSSISVESGKLKSGSSKLYFEQSGTRGGTLKWTGQLLGFKRQNYGLGDAMSISYSKNGNIITCSITYSDGSAETITWTLA